MANKLAEKLLKIGSTKHQALFSESQFFNNRELVMTRLPALNIALSGDARGGVGAGITIIGGESKTFKTSTSLFAIQAYLAKYPDAVCVMYDNEFGAPPEYFQSFGIDITRVIHVPVEHIEQVKFDMVKKLEALERGDKVFFFFDSIGNIASKKEIEDAIEEKSVADMTRAKAIRSLFRCVSPVLLIKDMPFFVVAHTYKTMEMFAKNVIGGGTSLYYVAHTILIMSRSQDKKDKDSELEGWNFTLNIEKGRFSKERKSVEINVKFDRGINQFSGLWEIGLESGMIVSESKGWYKSVDEDGVVSEKQQRRKEMENAKFWNAMLKNQKFLDFIRKNYKANSDGAIIQFEDEVDPDIEADADYEASVSKKK